MSPEEILASASRMYPTCHPPELEPHIHTGDCPWDCPWEHLDRDAMTIHLGVWPMEAVRWPG